MKSRPVLSRKVQNIAIETANREVDRQVRDITRRNIYIMWLSLHNEGVDNETLLAALHNMNEQVVPAYGEYRRDNLGDAALIAAVKSIGLPVEEMDSEL